MKGRCRASLEASETWLQGQQRRRQLTSNSRKVFAGLKTNGGWQARYSSSERSAGRRGQSCIAMWVIRAWVFQIGQVPSDRAKPLVRSKARLATSLLPSLFSRRACAPDQTASKEVLTVLFTVGRTILSWPLRDR